MTEATICNIRETDLAFCVPPDTIPRPMLATALAAIYDDIGGVRDAVMNIWGLCGISAAVGRHREFGGAAPWSLKSLACLFAYGSGYLGGDTPDPRKAIHIMNIDGMVTAWVPIIRGLCVGHDKAEIDRCEFESQEHLAPLLTCKVSQLREFFDKLCTALRTDPTIPLFVHSMFDAYNEGVVRQAADQKIKELKTALATEIADLVEEQVRPDLKAAMVGALQWRGAKELTEVRDAVKAGAVPRVKGRESCLFLTVPRTDAPELAVML
jgi:hypothetical protein